MFLPFTMVHPEPIHISGAETIFVARERFLSAQQQVLLPKGVLSFFASRSRKFEVEAKFSDKNQANEWLRVPENLP